MSDSDEAIPLASLARKERRRQQWRNSQKRKRDAEKVELDEGQVAAKRQEERERKKL